MARESWEWTVPAPVRALLWWPAIAFVLVIVAPDAAVGLIVAAGAALAALGLLLSRIAARLREAPAVAPAGAPAVPAPTAAPAPAPTAAAAPAPTAAAAPAPAPAVERPAEPATTEFPTVQFAQVDGRQEHAA